MPISMPHRGIAMSYSWTDPALDNSYSVGDTVSYAAASLFSVRTAVNTLKFHVIRNTVDNIMGFHVFCLCW